MEGESHLPRKPQSLSLEIKVFSFSVSLGRVSNKNVKIKTYTINLGLDVRDDFFEICVNFQIYVHRIHIEWTVRTVI